MSIGELSGIIILVLSVVLFFVVFPIVFYNHKASLGVKSMQFEGSQGLLTEEQYKGLSSIRLENNNIVFVAQENVKTLDVEVVLFKDNKVTSAKFFKLDFGSGNRITLKNFSHEELTGANVVVRSIDGERQDVKTHIIGPQRWMVVLLAIVQSLSIFLGLLFYVLGRGLYLNQFVHPTTFGNYWWVLLFLLLTPVIGVVSYLFNIKLLDMGRAK